MSELDAVKTSRKPVTAASLGRDLAALGVSEGTTLLVHVSLSALGWVCGGPVTVIAALLEQLGEAGTLALPAFSGDYSDPSHWCAPPVPEAWFGVIRREMPAFDPAVTPTRAIGAVAECFRRWPGAARSSHPQASFSAVGRHAARVTANHELDFILGEGSPLARLYELDAHVLLLGVGHDRNTSLHLAEYRADYRRKREIEGGAPVMRDGRRAWATFRDIDPSTDDFVAIGDAFAAHATSGKVGAADATLMRQRELVDFAVAWMEANR